MENERVEAGHRQAGKLTAQRRLEDLYAIRLDGAEFPDIREYVREKEAEAGSAWHLKEGETPLSDSQIRRYLARADQLVCGTLEHSRKKIRNRRLRQRRRLYAKAMAAGDLRCALSVLDSESRLLGFGVPEYTEVADTGDEPEET